jgi:circadian clock protein KaiB
MKTKKTPEPLVTQDKMVLQLYVAGMTQRSMQAIENIKTLCDKYLADAFELEIIDIYKRPEVAVQQQIVFSPSLIKRLPLPKKIMVGNFSDTEKVLNALGIKIKE